MAKATFIDDVYIKKKTPLAASIDVALLLPYIETTQDNNFENILGTEMYNRLQQGIIDADLTADEQTLMGYIRIAHVWLTAADAIPFIATQVRNVGVMQNSTDHSQPADTGKVKMLIAACKSKSDFYMNSLNLYLCDNGKLFELYIKAKGPRFPEEKKFDTEVYIGNQKQMELRKLAKKYLQ